jgi:hypothetical protein
MDRRSWPWKKKSSDKSSNADALQNSNQEQVCQAFLCTTPSVLKYMTPLTFDSNFDHQYLLNKLVN